MTKLKEKHNNWKGKSIKNISEIMKIRSVTDYLDKKNSKWIYDDDDNLIEECILGLSFDMFYGVLWILHI